MWNSNALSSWVPVRSGIDAESIEMPAHGRAPGWHAGIVVARQSMPAADQCGAIESASSGSRRAFHWATIHAAPLVGPVVVSEIMYNPEAGGGSEYIELRNITGAEGTHHLVVQGVSRFRVLEFLEGWPFVVARVEMVTIRDRVALRVVDRHRQLTLPVACRLWLPRRRRRRALADTP